MSIVIPRHPQEVSLSVTHQWNGDAATDERVRADVWLSQAREGLLVRVESPVLHEQRVPDAPMGARVEGLWEFDVVEVFLVGPGHEYLEIELGAGGHWLVLGFDRIRHRSNAYETFSPIVRYRKTETKTWVSEIVIPWNMVPENLRALNAFVIAAGQFMAHSVLPGVEADFHQPDYYPSARLA